MAKFLLNLCNHSQLGQRSLEDPTNILIHQLRALGHQAEWRPGNDQLITGPDSWNIIVEGFTTAAIDFVSHYHAQGARFICLATEEPTERGFNHGIDQEMRLRQKNFGLAGPYMDAIWYLVPGQHVQDYYGQFAPSHYVELGWAKTLERFDKNARPTYEFGFYGSLTNRRMKILKRLAKRTRLDKAVRLMGDFKSGEERDRCMREAKVIILVRKFDRMGLVSSSRCNTALCIGRPVIGEPHALAEEWEGIVRFSNTEEAFLNEAMFYRAAWEGLHAAQFERFKRKLTPELCVGRAIKYCDLKAKGSLSERQFSVPLGAMETVEPSQVLDAA